MVPGVKTGPGWLRPSRDPPPLPTGKGDGPPQAHRDPCRWRGGPGPRCPGTAPAARPSPTSCSPMGPNNGLGTPPFTQPGTYFASGVEYQDLVLRTSVNLQMFPMGRGVAFSGQNLNISPPPPSLFGILCLDLHSKRGEKYTGKKLAHSSAYCV